MDDGLRSGWLERAFGARADALFGAASFKPLNFSLFFIGIASYYFLSVRTFVPNECEFRRAALQLIQIKKRRANCHFAPASWSSNRNQ
jgi:hypothetical protein